MSAKQKRKVWAEVTCMLHGVKSDNAWRLPAVKVSLPKHKGIRGCPLCKNNI